MHAAQHRAYRELYAGARHLAAHWSALGPRLTGDPEARAALAAGAEAARGLLEELAELTAGEDLYGYPAAQGVGTQVAGARNAVGDLFLERNQALRIAVLDAHHVVVLLGYLAALARADRAGDHAELCDRWERRMKRVEGRARRAAIAAGERPTWAVEPVVHGPLGRAGHGVAYAVGTVGEWVDRRAGRAWRAVRSR